MLCPASCPAHHLLQLLPIAFFIVIEGTPLIIPPLNPGLVEWLLLVAFFCSNQRNFFYAIITRSESDIDLKVVFLV